MKTAHLAVEIVEASCQTRESAVRLIGLSGSINGIVERALERLEATTITSGFRDLVEKLFSMLDLLLWRAIDRRVECAAEHLFSDLDQLSSHREIVDRAAIVWRIDDGRRFGCEAGEILRNG